MTEQKICNTAPELEPLTAGDCAVLHMHPSTKVYREKIRELNDAGTKWCRPCSTLRPMASFSSDTSKFDGLAVRCRTCDVVAVIKYQHTPAGRAAKAAASVRYAHTPAGRASQADRKARYIKTPKGRAKGSADRARRRTRELDQQPERCSTPEHTTLLMYFYALRDLFNDTAFPIGPPTNGPLEGEHDTPIACGGATCIENMILRAKRLNVEKGANCDWTPGPPTFASPPVRRDGSPVSYEHRIYVPDPADLRGPTGMLEDYLTAQRIGPTMFEDNPFPEEDAMHWYEYPDADAAPIDEELP